MCCDSSVIVDGYKNFDEEFEVDTWTVYNNTLSLKDLRDQHAAELFNQYRAGEVLEQLRNDKWEQVITCSWGLGEVYRIYRFNGESFGDLFYKTFIELFDLSFADEDKARDVLINTNIILDRCKE